MASEPGTDEIDDGRDRWPPAVYAKGGDPDPRFSMANERTALAWLRTAMAVVAGGVGLTSIAQVITLPWADGIAAGMCVIGVLLAVAAVDGWRRREVAMRTGRPLPAPMALFGFAAALVGVFAVIAVTVLARSG